VIAFQHAKRLIDNVIGAHLVARVILQFR